MLRLPAPASVAKCLRVYRGADQSARDTRDSVGFLRAELVESLPQGAGRAIASVRSTRCEHLGHSERTGHGHHDPASPAGRAAGQGSVSGKSVT